VRMRETTSGSNWCENVPAPGLRRQHGALQKHVLRDMTAPTDDVIASTKQASRGLSLPLRREPRTPPSQSYPSRYLELTPPHPSSQRAAEQDGRVPCGRKNGVQCVVARIEEGA